MRSQLSVRRSHIRQQLTNRRKNMGRVAKSQYAQFKRWLQTAVLPDPIADKRKQVFDALELNSHEPVQASETEKAKKREKKKAVKQNPEEEEAKKKQNEKKAAEREARRKEAEAKKRAAEEEEYKKWRAEQEKIASENAKREEEEKKLKEKQKREKVEQTKNAKSNENKKGKGKSAKEPVTEKEVVLKQVNNVESALEPKTPTNTPAEPDESEIVQKVENKKKNKKNKRKSESETAPAQEVVAENKKTNDKKSNAETESNIPAEKIENIPEEVQASEKSANDGKKKNKKDKKKSESESAEKTTARPTSDDPMDFLDFVSAKPKKIDSAVESVIENKKINENEFIKTNESVPSEVQSSEKSSKGNKKNKKDKKKSESESAEKTTARPTSDDPMDFLDFVSAKPEKTEDEPNKVEQVLEYIAQKGSELKEKIETNLSSVVSDNTESRSAVDESMDFLDFVTPKSEKKEIESHAGSVEVSREPKAKKNSESESNNKKSMKDDTHIDKADKGQFKTSDDCMDILNFVTPKKDNDTPAIFVPDNRPLSTNKKGKRKQVSECENPSLPPNSANDNVRAASAEPSSLPVQNNREKSKSKSPAPGKKMNKKNKKHTHDNLPADDPNADKAFMDFLYQKESTVDIESEPVTNEKSKKNKKNSESEKTVDPEVSQVKNENGKKQKNNKKQGENGSNNVVEEIIEKKTIIVDNEANTKTNEIDIPSSDVISEPQYVEIPQNEQSQGKGSPSSDKENSRKPIINGDGHDENGGGKKNKKKNKKNKNSNSISERETRISELDHLDEMADNEVEAITGAAKSHSPPIQVHEVSSTDECGNMLIEKTTTIHAHQEIEGGNEMRTQFQQNVEKLVQATLAKHDIVEIDPTVKMRIDAQLIKLSEKKEPAIVREHVNYIKPLPMELHISRPSTPSRERLYKLLPKDILFCAGLIDTHGDNYSAMANDSRNVFKDNARSLQRKIRIFKDSPHFQTYLRAKEENRPLEELIGSEAH